MLGLFHLNDLKCIKQNPSKVFHMIWTLGKVLCTLALVLSFLDIWPAVVSAGLLYLLWGCLHSLMWYQGKELPDQLKKADPGELNDTALMPAIGCAVGMLIAYIASMHLETPLVTHSKWTLAFFAVWLPLVIASWESTLNRRSFLRMWRNRRS